MHTRPGRRFAPARSVLILVAALLLTAAACTTATPSGPVVVSLPKFNNLLFFGPGSSGPTVIAPPGIVSVAGPGQNPTSTSTPPTSTGSTTNPVGGSIDLQGKAWWILGDGSPATSSGQHPAAARIQGLIDGAQVAGQTLNLQADPWGVAVVDADTVLVAANTNAGTTSSHAQDSVVFRVSSSVAAVVAGKPGDGSDAPISVLRPGSSASPTGVSLELVQAVVPLAADSFVLLMNEPTSAENASDSKLQAAWVHAGTITRVAIPDLCAGQYRVRGVRTNDDELVVSAPTPTTGGRCQSAAPSTWLSVNVSSGTTSVLGSGDGLAFRDGSQLVTAASPVSSGEVTVTWRALPTG